MTEVMIHNFYHYLYIFRLTFINKFTSVLNRIDGATYKLSLCYNIIGLYFAVTGQLMPVIAAILMPLSSISIVVFTTISTNILGKKLNK